MIIFVLLLGALIIFLLQRILYAKLWNKGLDIRIEFEGRAAYETEKGSLTEVVTNRNFLPLPFIHAKFMVGSGLSFGDRENIATTDKNYKNDIFSVLFYQRVRRRLNFVALKRGYYRIDNADLVASDLFYTRSMVAAFPQDTAFYVYPRRIDLSRLDQPLRKMIGDMTSRTFLYPDPFEFKGLRNYTISDPMNTINWKASAKTGELMVNLYDSTTTRRIVILLDLEDELLIRHLPLFEESIRLAAGLSEKLLSEGFPVKMICNGKDLESRETVPVLEALGISEVEDFFRIMARIDLNVKPEEFYPMIEHEMEDPAFGSAGYILIAPCMKQELQDAYMKLASEAACIWITPLYRNMDSHLKLPEEADVIRWEVPGRA